MTKNDIITLMLTESQYLDPKMQELIKNADRIEIISDEEFERIIAEESHLKEIN